MVSSCRRQSEVCRLSEIAIALSANATKPSNMDTTFEEEDDKIIQRRKPLACVQDVHKSVTMESIQDSVFEVIAEGAAAGAEYDDYVEVVQLPKYGRRGK